MKYILVELADSGDCDAAWVKRRVQGPREPEGVRTADVTLEMLFTPVDLIADDLLRKLS